MPRIKRGVTTRQKHKRLLDQAKGYRGRRKNTIRIARQAVEKAGQYGVKLAGIELDRKVMADLAMNEEAAFKSIIAQAKAALPA